MKRSRFGITKIKTNLKQEDISQKKKTKAEEEKTWSDEEVGDLIDLFESKPCLWNIHDPSYAKRDEKELAYSSTAEQFETTIQAIKAKLNGLRAQFGREMSKCLKVRANRTTNKAEMLDENIGRFAPALREELGVKNYQNCPFEVHQDYKI